MMEETEWTVVIPAPEDISQAARDLLSLADPKDVLTIRNGMEFLVPSEVADAYHALKQQPEGSEPAAAPRRRGRAPKITETEA